MEHDTVGPGENRIEPGDAQHGGGASPPACLVEFLTWLAWQRSNFSCEPTSPCDRATLHLAIRSLSWRFHRFTPSTSQWRIAQGQSGFSTIPVS